MASRALTDLHPDLEVIAEAFLALAKSEGIDPLIYCTWRSNQEQDELYAIGRTKPGRIVTRARGGQSDHNFTIGGRPAAKAFDCVPLFNGKPLWNNTALYARLGAIAAKLGLQWYGAPGSKFFERAHFCLP